MDARSTVDAERTTRAARAATAILLARSEPLFVLAALTDPVADSATLADLHMAATGLRETMRLFSPLYPRSDYERWVRRLRLVTRLVAPLLKADSFMAAIHTASRRMGVGGKRATAFLVGYLSATRGYESSLVANRVESLGLPERRAAFRRFARDPKSGADSKATLQVFAAAALGERVSAFYDRAPDDLAEADAGVVRLAGKALSRLVSAAEALSPCYSEDEYAALHTALTALETPFDAIRDARDFLEVLHEPDLVPRARRAGVSPTDLAEVEDAFTQRLTRLTTDAQRAMARHPETDLRAALLSPLVPGFIVTDAEPAAATPKPAEPADAVGAPSIAEPPALETAVSPEPAAPPKRPARAAATKPPAKARASASRQAAKPRASTRKPPAVG
jgi:hypothetical protein